LIRSLGLASCRIMNMNMRLKKILLLMRILKAITSKRVIRSSQLRLCRIFIYRLTSSKILHRQCRLYLLYIVSHSKIMHSLCSSCSLVLVKTYKTVHRNLEVKTNNRKTIFKQTNSFSHKMYRKLIRTLRYLNMI